MSVLRLIFNCVGDKRQPGKKRETRHPSSKRRNKTMFVYRRCYFFILEVLKSPKKKLRNKDSKVSGYKINVQRSVECYYFYMNNSKGNTRK